MLLYLCVGVCVCVGVFGWVDGYLGVFKNTRTIYVLNDLKLKSLEKSSNGNLNAEIWLGIN